MSPIIETRDLVKTYQQAGKPLRVLKSVDLVVEPGEFTAIMGPSGSGKSTLLNMIGALDRPRAVRCISMDTPSADSNPLGVHQT